jgi:hypothetical protein
MRDQIGKSVSEAEIHHATRAERGRHRKQRPAPTKPPKKGRKK